MRLLILYIFAGTLLVPKTQGQTPSCTSHPTDPGAQFLNSFVLTVTISSGSSFFSDNTNCQSHNEVCVWLMSDGSQDYVVDVAHTTFTGECGEVDLTPLSNLLDLISSAAVEEGIILGYPPCTGTTSSTDTVEVLTTSCAERSGTGAGTTFDACDSIWCKRVYEVKCIEGVPTVTELPGVNSNCTGTPSSCEEGCGDT
ncbi:MAG: hypothetical protein KDD67_09440 [Ignavibacteriae bacterium]|nr:hypothetical protein [Ignavibacteriota bacterium]MCB9216433.1 hypothetical protein [Ignavibacteria bacterium]